MTIWHGRMLAELQADLHTERDRRRSLDESLKQLEDRLGQVWPMTLHAATITAPHPTP